MKKIQLIAVNAKYSHTNPAVRLLREAILPYPSTITEITINDQLQRSAEMILNHQSDIYCFSCYIWNIRRVLELSEIVKKSQPDCEIYFGGPEVSYDHSELLTKYPWIDGIFCGESEKSFAAFVKNVNDHNHEAVIPGLITGTQTESAFQVIENMDELPGIYTDDELVSLKNRILYYESMRGCPFQCAYCLSSTLPSGVRCLSLDRVFEDLNRFIRAEVRQVKFVDRTFNIHPKRAKKILEYLIEKQGKTNFHFEIAADLLDDEMLSIIRQAPKGLFQFEIGIQSTDQTTLSAVSRKTDLYAVKKNIERLLSFGNCHVHVDLIAGLPYEDLSTFSRSYNETIALRPDMLQLGFLKLLKGTRIRHQADEYDYRFTSFPPYEVISNRFIHSEELRLLKKIEALTEDYYNSGAFKQTMNYIFDGAFFETPFDCFREMAQFWADHGYDQCAHAREALYPILGQFIEARFENTLIWDWLALDALLSGCKHLPEGFPNEAVLSGEQRFEIAKNEALFQNNEMLHPLLAFAPKKRVKYLRFHIFSDAFSEKNRFTGQLGIFYNGQVVFDKI